MEQVANRIAWVTGAGTGIGRALALRLAREGWDVAISGRRTELLEEVKALGGELAGKLMVVPVDVTDRTAMRQAAERIEHELGPLHLVVLSAGMFETFRAHRDFDPAAFDAHFAVNFTGVINGIHAALPALKRRQSGHFVIISSLSGYRGLPLAAPYAASKAALISLAESLKFQFDRLNITTTVATPGFVATPLTENKHFPMPFMVDSAVAADRLYRGIERGAFEITFPRRLSWLLKLVRCLPYALYFPLIKSTMRRR